MSTIIDLVNTDNGATSMATINTNFDTLNTDKEDVSNKQTDLTASATKYPTVNAVNTGLATKQNSLGYTAENNANKKTSLADNSDTFYPTQKAVKTAVDAKQNTLTFTPEDSANKENTTLDTSTTKYPCNNVVKTAVDGKMANPMSATGDIIYGGASGVATRLAKGTDGQILELDSGLPAWKNKGVTPINAQTGNYTLVLSDTGKLITLTSSSAITLTIPTNASVAFPIGTQIDLSQMGAGKVTFAGAGVTINSKGGNKAIADKFVGVSLIKTDTNTWLLVGDLIA